MFSQVGFSGGDGLSPTFELRDTTGTVITGYSPSNSGVHSVGGGSFNYTKEYTAPAGYSEWLEYWTDGTMGGEVRSFPISLPLSTWRVVGGGGGAGIASRTFLSLQQDVLTRLRQYLNSSIVNLMAGTGGTTITSTLTSIKLYLNEGKNIVARRGYPVVSEIAGTYEANTASVLYSQMETGDNSVIFAVRDIATDAAMLSYADYSRLRNEGLLTASGTPSYFTRLPASGFALYPRPTVDTDITLTAFVIPADLVDDGDTYSWLSADLADTLIFYACAMVAKVAQDNAEVRERVGIWQAEFDKRMEKMRADLIASDPNAARVYFAG